MATPKERNKMRIRELVAAFRAQYEPRVKQLEADVLEWCCSLDRAEKREKAKSEPKKRNGSGKDTEKKVAVYWQYDMKGFSLEEITLHHEGSSLHLHALHKSRGKSLEMKKEIVLPTNVDESKISSKLSSRGLLTISVSLKTDIPKEKSR